MPQRTTTKISFEGLGAESISSTDVDPDKAKKPNKGRIHEGPLVPVEHGLSLTAGYEGCKVRKCNRPVVHEGECAVHHAITIAKRNRQLEREQRKAQGRRLKEMSPDDKAAYHQRRVDRVKNYARTGSDEAFERLKGSEVLAATALRIEVIAAASDAPMLLQAYDLKAARKHGLEDD